MFVDCAGRIHSRSITSIEKASSVGTALGNRLLSEFALSVPLDTSKSVVGRVADNEVSRGDADEEAPLMVRPYSWLQRSRCWDHAGALYVYTRNSRLVLLVVKLDYSAAQRLCHAIHIRRTNRVRRRDLINV